MKKIISFTLAFILALSILLVLPVSTNAARETTQHGLEVGLSTNKSKYSAGSAFDVSVTVKNTNPYTVQNITIETVLPDGLTAETDELSESGISLFPGETRTLKATVRSAPNFVTTIIIVSICVALVIAAVVTILLVVKRKKKAQVVSTVLCLALLLSMMPAGVSATDGDTATISVDKVISIDGKKCTIQSNVIVSIDAVSPTSTVSFDTNGGSRIESQTVPKGATASITTFPEKEGYAFVGWYTDNEFTALFDFSQPIYASCTAYARWVDITDTTDTDGDGLTDPVEEYFGTDISNIDTDRDGLSDFVEVTVLSLDPLKKDTDNDSIADGNEDSDSDGLTNLEEIQLGTSPVLNDTDGDLLLDKKELELHTDPQNRDTDNDGVSDGKEIELGTDPLTVQSAFDVTLSVENASDSVKPSVEITLPGSQVETLRIEEYSNDNFFPDTMPGYMGKAYDFGVDGQFSSATISFEFDVSMLGTDAEPVICYFNEETQELEELTTTINGNVASATVTHFSKYILIDRKVYQDSFTWTDVWDSNNTYTDVEVVLVIDDSGSMDRNDGNNQRLDVARTLIDKLPQNSKIGIIRFESSTDKLTSQLTSDKNLAKSYLTTSYFHSYGNTYMYSAINSALQMYESFDSTTLRMMIVLSDGESNGTGSHNATITSANNYGVKIYTVGLGSASSTYFFDYLKPLAMNTGGSFYYASDAVQLAEIYENISEKIDIETDADDDGIPDYYEDNMICFNGVSLTLDKNNPDTDGDGLKDGEELILKYEYNADRTQVKVTGKLVGGNPANHDTDGDGYPDAQDLHPFVWDVSDRDLAILSQLIYSDKFRDINNFAFSSLDASTIQTIDADFHNTASIQELTGWTLVQRNEFIYDHYIGGLCFGVFTKDNNVVIAIRGSYGELDLISNADWRNNVFTYPIDTDPDTEYLLANISTIAKKYVQPGDNLYITGHSRGGMLAQRAAVALVKDDCADMLNRVVYFNGIGVVFCEGLWGVGKSWHDSLESISHKVTRYNILGDFVDALGVHVVSSNSFYATSIAKGNHDGGLKYCHVLCNFTYYLMPERYKTSS